MGRVYLNEGWKFTENFSMDILQSDIADAQWWQEYKIG